MKTSKENVYADSHVNLQSICGSVDAWNLFKNKKQYTQHKLIENSAMSEICL